MCLPLLLRRASGRRPARIRVVQQVNQCCDVRQPVFFAGPHGEVDGADDRSEEHTSELQSRLHLVCRLLLSKKKKEKNKANQHEYSTTERAHTSAREHT